MAAAGLFNSCASPAASVPRAAIFSFWITIDSVLRNLEVTVCRIFKEADALRERNVRKAVWSITNRRLSRSVRTEADRGVCSSNAISPKNCPALYDASKTSWLPWLLVTSSCPSRTTLKRVSEVTLPQHELPCGETERLRRFQHLLEVLFGEVCEKRNPA